MSRVPSCSNCGVELKPSAEWAMDIEKMPLYTVRLTCPRYRGDESHDNYCVCDSRGIFKRATLFSESELAAKGIITNVA